MAICNTVATDAFHDLIAELLYTANGAELVDPSLWRASSGRATIQEIGRRCVSELEQAVILPRIMFTSREPTTAQNETNNHIAETSGVLRPNETEQHEASQDEHAADRQQHEAVFFPTFEAPESTNLPLSAPTSQSDTDRLIQELAELQAQLEAAHARIAELKEAPGAVTTRTALVVGIDAYKEIPALAKAINDARAISTTLERLGFDVVTAIDTGRRELNKVIADFAANIRPGDEVVFFFAGHGVEIEGRNFLLPADVRSVRPGQEAFLRAEAVSVDSILDGIRERRARVSLLILDACRDNPFAREGTRSVGGSRGLGGMTPPEGTFILYSAGLGQAALDSLGADDPNQNSVFTRMLLRLMEKPDLTIVDLARQVRRDVEALARSVGHDQRPAYYDEVLGDFIFTRQ